MNFITMKKVFVSFLGFLLLSSFMGGGVIGIFKDTNSYIWFSNDYVNCLENQLPCECEKIANNYFFITLDTNKKSKFYGVKALKYNDNEFEQFDIKETTSGTYKAYTNIEDTSSYMGLIVLQKNILFFIDRSNNKIVFKNYDRQDNNDELQYGKQNIKIINNAFVRRGYLPLERILNQDSLSCNCNNELGGVNLITVNGYTKCWIIEQKGDSIYVYYFVNSSDDKIVPFIINKKLIEKYKW